MSPSFNQEEILFTRIQALLNGGEYQDEKNNAYDADGTLIIDSVFQEKED